MSNPPTPKRLRRTIDDEDSIAYLISQRKITPTNNAGFRSLSVNAYSPLSSQSSTDSIEIPEVVESIQTLQIAGFTPSAAEEAFDTWKALCLKWPEGDLTLEKSACDYISIKAHVLDACSPGDDYEAAWVAMGFDPHRARKLVAPHYEEIRLMSSASQEFKDSVRDVFEELYSLPRKIQEQKRSLEARADSPEPGSVATPAIRDTPGLRNVSGATPQVQTVVKLPDSVDDHIMLYKGALTSRLEKVWQNPDSNEISIEALISTPPTDFHRESKHIIYFGKELQTAAKYCSYQSDRTPFARLGILHIAVPKTLVAEPDFKWIYGSQWRRLVWESRGRLQGLPAHWRLSADLETFLDGKGLGGKISHTNNDAMQKLGGMEEIGEMSLQGGGKATQYAFFRKAWDEINRDCKGKIWIEERQMDSHGDTQQSTGVGIHRAL